VIAQLQNEDYIAMRTLSCTENGEITLSPLCLLDADEAAESSGLNEILDVQINHENYSFLYPKPFDVHLTAPQITRLDVTLQHPAWRELEDPHVDISAGTETSSTSYPLPEHAERIVLPEGVYFDPRTIGAHITSVAHVTIHEDLAEAERSMIYTDARFHLLVLCSPEGLVKAQMDLPSHQQRQWRVWLTGWDNTWSTQHWTYAPDLGVPSDPEHFYWPWPTVHMAVIAGPPSPAHASGTIVAAIAMLKEEEALSHGVCLDEQGQVVQVCTSPLGLCPSLCCCAQLVVGVDRLEGRWRLWNWPVFRQQKLQTLLTLEASCQRAFVYAEPASGYFWLIEERQEGVSVSYRDASTLEEQVPATDLPGVHLFPGPGEDDTLDPSRYSGILPYRDTLLLLAESPEGELVLYQIEKSEEG
jgi:hypothetical protein